MRATHYCVGMPPTSQPIDNVEHNMAYNPFEDGPICHKARESTESFNSAIYEDIYSQQVRVIFIIAYNCL